MSLERIGTRPEYKAIRGGSPALLILDMIGDSFKSERLAKTKEALVGNINGLAEIAREDRVPVIWTREEFKADLSDLDLTRRRNGVGVAIEGTEGSRFLPDLDVQDGDYEVIKKRYSPFFGTKLDELLNGLQVGVLIVAGVNTHACVHTTIVDAYQRDYEIAIATDCVDSYDDAYNREAMRYLTQKMATPQRNFEIPKFLRDKLMRL